MKYVVLTIFITSIIFWCSNLSENNWILINVPVTDPDLNASESFKNIPFKIKMIVDKNSKTGYRIPLNIDQANNILRLSLGEDRYYNYIVRFDDYYCSKNIEIIRNKLIPISNYFYFMALSWGLDSEGASSKIKTGNYFFFEELPPNQKIMSIVATINHGYKDIGDKPYCLYYTKKEK